MNWVDALIEKVIDCCGEPEMTRDISSGDADCMVELALAAKRQRQEESGYERVLREVG